LQHAESTEKPTLNTHGFDLWSSFSIPYEPR